jgi:hypothetical protein
VRFPHLAHAAFANGRDDLVWAEFVAGLQFHASARNRFNPLYRVARHQGSPSP